jgi:hypothetical protein
MNWKKASEVTPLVNTKILVKTRAQTDSEYYGPDLGKAVTAGTFRTEKRKHYVRVEGSENLYKLEYKEHVWFDSEEIDEYAIDGAYYEWVEFPE